MTLNQISDILVAAVIAATKNIQPVTQIQEKTAQDYVTDLDLAIEAKLINYIQDKLSIPVYSEEQIQQTIDLPANEFIVIDPLDGTLNAICNLGLYATSVAYVNNKTPQIGITYDFRNKELFQAIANSGLFYNQQPVTPKSTASKVFSVSTDFLTQAYTQPSIIQNLRAFGKIRSLGSQTLALAYVAFGRSKFNINIEAKYWDDAAGYVMLQEAGMLHKNLLGADIFPKDQLDPNEQLLSLACKPEELEQLLAINSTLTH